MSESEAVKPKIVSQLEYPIEKDIPLRPAKGSQYDAEVAAIRALAFSDVRSSVWIPIEPARVGLVVKKAGLPTGWYSSRKEVAQQRNGARVWKMREPRKTRRRTSPHQGNRTMGPDELTDEELIDHFRGAVELGNNTDGIAWVRADLLSRAIVLMQRGIQKEQA